MTVEQQALAAVQAGVTRAAFHNLPLTTGEDNVSGIMVETAVAAVAGAGDVAREALAAGAAVAYVGNSLGLSGEQQVQLASEAAFLAGSAGGLVEAQSGGIRAAGAAALLAGQRNASQSQSVSELVAR